MKMSLKKSARDKVEKLVRKYHQSTKSDYTEKDTITIFILPFLESLGWDIYDVYEVKQEGYPRSFVRQLPVKSRAIDKPDCVISLNDKPYMVLEFKGLNYGKEVDRYAGEVEKLLGKAEYLHTRYAVLTSFREIVVYDRTSEKQLVEFREPKQYLSRFEELWEHLSRERAVAKIEMELTW